MAEKPQKHYLPTRKELNTMSKCIKAGYKVFPTIPKWQKHWPLVILSITYRMGKPVESKEPPFSQMYLGYKMFKLYNMIYERKVLKAIKNTAPAPPRKIMKFPPGPPVQMAPPPPIIKLPNLAAPPPPKK